MAGGQTSRCLRPHRWPSSKRTKAAARRAAASSRTEAAAQQEWQRGIKEAQQAAQGVGQHAVIVRPGGLTRGVDEVAQSWMVGVGLTRQSIRERPHCFGVA